MIDKDRFSEILLKFYETDETAYQDFLEWVEAFGFDTFSNDPNELLDWQWQLAVQFAKTNDSMILKLNDWTNAFLGGFFGESDN